MPWGQTAIFRYSGSIRQLISGGGAKGRRVALLVSAIALVILHLGGFLAPIDQSLAAFQARLIRQAPSDSIVVVTIDPRSLHENSDWPWPRERFAQAITNLREAGATVIGFDVDFSARSDAHGDAMLQAAIDENPGSIVLPTFVQSDGAFRNLPLASLAQNAVLASVNIPIDQDGITRRYVRGYQSNDGYQPSMASALAGRFNGATSAFSIDYGFRETDIDTISFADVYDGGFDPARVNGRAVLIGATALEFGDLFATPRSPATPGVYLHAIAYENIVAGRTLWRLNETLLCALGLLTLVLLWPHKRIDLRTLIIRHASVALVAIVAPWIARAIAPVSIDAAIVLTAQFICFCVSVQYELTRRQNDLVRQRETHLRHAALHDPETDLPNRRAMTERLQQLLSSKNDQTIAVIAYGIDRFSLLRGAIGHSSANAIIGVLAEKIDRELGEPDVYRVSESALGVALTVSSPEEAQARCRDTLAQFSHLLVDDEHNISISCRAGLAVYQEEPHASAEKCLEHAVLALDEARANKTLSAVFDAQTFADPKFRLDLLSNMKLGLERGEFYLVYQPKYSLRDQSIVGAEALMRWTHPQHGPIGPDKFIIAAEETGAIDALTRWALARVVSDQKRMRDQGVDIEVSVNISGQLLGNRAFCDYALEVLRNAQTKICLEITETAIIEDPIEAIDAIEEFRAANAKISIDDYGVGLSSLSYLKQIPANELKLDKSLVNGVATHERDRWIVKSTIDLAHGLNLKVVAEGVEDTHDLGLLASLGCDTIQGFVISRALRLEDFVYFVSAAAGGPLAQSKTNIALR